MIRPPRRRPALAPRKGEEERSYQDPYARLIAFLVSGAIARNSLGSELLVGDSLRNRWAALARE